MTGIVVIPAQFDFMPELLSHNFYDDGFAVVKLGDYFGVIDMTGEVVVNLEYDYIWDE